MTSRRSLDLVFLPGMSAPDGTYDAAGATYDEPGWTYDQQGTDPIAAEYAVTAYPGWGPRSPDWTYRQWDTSPDMEISLLAPDGTAIDYSLIESARVSWSMTTYGGYPYEPSAPLAVEADRLRRRWGPSDLLVPGRYRVTVHLVFTSGRTLSIPSTDDTALVVVEGARVEVEPAASPVPDAPISPFILYNWETYGATTGTFPNSGSKGAIFDVPRSTDETYWALGCGMVSPQGPCVTPNMSTLEDIGGSWCGEPLSVVISTAPGGEMFGPAWRCTGPSGGWAWRVFFEYLASGACFVEFHVQEAFTTPSTSQPAAIFSWTGSSSEDITMVVTVDIANNTQPTLFIAGGGSPTPTDSSVYGAASCSAFDAGNGAMDETEYSLYGSGGIKGVGFYRGAGTQEIADYWHAYDWSS